MSQADPYAELADLAEAAAALAEAERFEELGPLFERSAAIAAELPEQPPRSARPQLERAAAAQRRLRARAGTSLEETRSELEMVGRRRRAAHSYWGSGAAALDLQA